MGLTIKERGRPKRKTNPAALDNRQPDAQRPLEEKHSEQPNGNGTDSNNGLASDGRAFSHARTLYLIAALIAILLWSTSFVAPRSLTRRFRR